MKKKLDLISLSKNELSKKQKLEVRGGFLGCCCSGHGMTNTWNGVRSLPKPQQLHVV